MNPLRFVDAFVCSVIFGFLSDSQAFVFEWVANISSKVFSYLFLVGSSHSFQTYINFRVVLVVKVPWITP